MTAIAQDITDLDDIGPIAEPGTIADEQLLQLIKQNVIPIKETIPEETPIEEVPLLPGNFPLTPSGKLLRRYITSEGFGDHHIEVYDNWITKSLYSNVYGRSLTFPNGDIVVFENLRVFKPQYTRDGKVLPLTPKLAREQGVTYGGDLHVDVVKRKGGAAGPEIDRKVSVCIGAIPIMLKSQNCILRNKNPRELTLLGESAKDPGGYFVISGTEKVCLLQEQLGIGKILLMNMDTKGSVVARMTCNTIRGTALVELALDKSREIIKMRFPSMRVPKQNKKYKSINVLRVFRYLGITNQEQIQNLISLFIKPEQVKKSMFKLTRNIVDFIMRPDDVEIIAAKIEKSALTQEQKLAEINRIFDTDLFPHVNSLPGPDGETIQDRKQRIIQGKIYLLAIMIAKFLEHLAGFRTVDNRDSWANKRVEGAGRMMEQLFRNAWRKTLSIVQAGIEARTVKDLGQVVEKIKYSVITDTFHDSFITSNWGVKGSQMKNNVAQTLVRDSVVATFAHINTVDVSISRTDRQQHIRMVQMDQWGFIDPTSTPEGENAGLLKNLSLTAKVSLDRDDTDIIRMLIGDIDRGIVPRVTANHNQTPGWNDKIMVNGKFLGWCNGTETREFLVQQRRSNEMPLDMTVVKDNDWVYVDLAPSRLVRPLLIVDPEQTLAIDRLNIRGKSNHTLLTSGAMEYISPWEQEYIKIATTIDKIKERNDLFNDANQSRRVAMINLRSVLAGNLVIVGDEGLTEELAQMQVTSTVENLKKLENNKPYTHCELDPQAILGVAAALIPWPNHNQAPRNTYQVSMGKQALGIYHTNHLNRFDGKTKILAFPNRPTVETELYDTLGLDEHGPGENIDVSFMAFPFTEEDAFVFKKEFLDNGGFRIYKYLTYKTIVKQTGDAIETLKRPEPKIGEQINRYRFIQMAEPGNSMNGLPMIGAPLRQGDCIIGKVQHIPSTKDITNESVFLRVGDDGVVEKILVTSDITTIVITVKLRVMRVPQEGDKFAPRNAQKGTIGLVCSDIDLPKDENGIAADMTANTHCFTADTPVSLKNGMARPLTSMLYDGNDKVWSLDKDKYRFVPSTSMGYESKGVRDIVKVTCSDGRVIRCTPEHRFPVLTKVGSLSIRKVLPISEVTKDMKLLAGIDGVIDAPTPEERQQELLWSLQTDEFNFSMNNTAERDKALAYARLLGLICTDGCISVHRNGFRGNICIGSHLDAEVVLDDIELITGKRPAVTKNQSELGGSTMTIALPAKFARSIASLKGMTVGKRTITTPEWPVFVLDKNCPKAIVREFLGGLFGGDGWAPYLVTNNTDGPGNTTFNAPAISLSATEELSDELTEKMEELVTLLESVGVPGARVDKPKRYDSHGGKEMVTCTVQLPRGVEFGDKVGFRYCIQKMYRMAAYQSYMRYLAIVKYQNDHIVQRTSEIYDSGSCSHSIQKALDIARKEFYAVNVPFNEYYSNATLDQIRNRRRADRSNTILKWDYSRIEDAVAYLRKIDAYHWFRSENGGAAEYIVEQNATNMPYFTLTVNSVIPIGQEEVFDLGVNTTHTLVVNGVAANNCIPSRMTISYLLELVSAKHAAYRGVHFDGGAFKPPEINVSRQTLKDYGKNEFGYETMRSGLSGKLLETPIFKGPVFVQALKHHVKDKVQARGLGAVKPMTRQPPKGRGNKGGLRFGKLICRCGE